MHNSANFEKSDTNFLKQIMFLKSINSFFVCISKLNGIIPLINPYLYSMCNGKGVTRRGILNSDGSRRIWRREMNIIILGTIETGNFLTIWGFFSPN